MDIQEIKEGKKQYLDLLLLADEQENMIDRYLTNATRTFAGGTRYKTKCSAADNF